MTVNEIRERVEKIRALAGDAEYAHGAEDDLHRDVLRAIAEGRCEAPAECAREALETTRLDFPRWCA